MVNEDMNVLVVGCGSIGKRHIKNLSRLDNIRRISVCTKVKDCLDNFNGKTEIEFTDSIEQSVQHPSDFDFAIIANETYKHIDTAIFLAEKGIHLFIEKPLSHNLERINLLNDIVQRKSLKVFVAYNLRFSGAIEYLKEHLAKNIIGDLYFAKIEAGQYLPDWRPHSDYIKSYSAIREKGGGVGLDLSHEIDYMRYLFGDPCLWKVFKTKVSRLEINSEDIFEGLFQYKNGFLCNIHLDYLQPEKRRKIRITGSRGTLVCDFIKKYIRLSTDNGESFIDDAGMFDFDRTYRDELLYFIETIKKDSKPCITMDDGVRILKLLEDGNV